MPKGVEVQFLSRAQIEPAKIKAKVNHMVCRLAN